MKASVHFEKNAYFPSIPCRAVWIYAFLLWTVGGLVNESGAQEQPSILQFASADVTQGDRVSLPIKSITDFPFQGFSIAAAYDPSVISIVDITIYDTITEAVSTDYFQANLYPEKGQFIIGVLVDLVPPYDDRQIPGPGIPVTLIQVIFDAMLSIPPTTTALRFVNGIGEPPISNVFSVSNQAIPPDQLIDGVIRISGPPFFVRGDSNQDGKLDISDPVFINNYLFYHGDVPPCRDAADLNDDERLDLADTVYALRYLFLHGNPPALPFPDPGQDPPPLYRNLDCLDPSI